MRLRKLGFNIGDLGLDKCEDGTLVITQDTSRVELIEREFMGEKTKKLYARFLAERKIRYSIGDESVSHLFY